MSQQSQFPYFCESLAVPRTAAPRAQKASRSTSRHRTDYVQIAVLVLFGVWAPRAFAQGAVRNNPGFLTGTMNPAANDDGSSSTAVALGFNANFFGTPYNSIWVNNNGNLTFTSPLSAYTPQGLSGSFLPIIAPFWADVDTRGTGSSVVTFGTDTVNGFPAFGANYINVGYYDSHSSPLDSFQVVLISRPDTGAGNFDIEFNYNQMLWEVGDASGGLNGLCTGSPFPCSSAAVGYSNGQCFAGSSGTCNSFQIAGSLVPGAFLDSNPNGLIHQSLNSSVPGRLIFNVRNGSVVCTYTLTPTNQSFGIIGGSGSVTVSAPAGCTWTASSNAGFINIDFGTGASGTGSVSYSVAPNPGAARSGTMSIAGQTFEVDQAGTSAGCSFAISPQALSFPMGGGSANVSVSAPSGCNWSASSLASFITVSNSTGSGIGTVGITVAPNGGASLRAGNVSIAGLLFAAVQAGSMPLLPLSISPSRVSVSLPAGSASATRSVEITSNNGSLGWSLVPQIFNGSGWMSISSTSGTASPAQPSVVNVILNPAGLSAGIYQAQLTLQNSSGTPVSTVAVVLNVSAAGPQLLLSQSSFVFSIQQGGSAPPTQTLQVVNVGQGNLNWSISSPTTTGFSPASPSNGVAAAGTAGSTVTLGVNPTGLNPGVYQNLFQVTAPGATDGNQTFLVTLQVVSNSAPARGETFPAGLFFATTQSGSTPAAQTLAINNAGGGTLPFTVQASTISGGNWLNISTTSGTAGPGPAALQVSVISGALLPGIYRGDVTLTFGSSGSQDVQVVLVVAPAGSTSGGGLSEASCAPTGMDLLATTISNGVNLPVAFPRSLLAQVIDSCGNLVNTASVSVSVDSLNIVLRSVGSGLYSGSWTPQNQSGAIAVVFTAVAPGLGTVERSYTVSTSTAPGGVTVPSILPDGVVGAAAFPPLRPLAPGSIIAIFGNNLATGINQATQLPLPPSLGNASVQIGGETAPLYYADSGQINAEVPYDLPAGQSVSIVVSANGLQAAPQNYVITPVQPAIFTAALPSGIVGVAIDAASGRLVTPANPAHIGDTLVIYSNALGLTDQNVVTGQASPQARALLPVTVTIGGVQVAAQYAGLTPTLVGLDQINVQLTSSVQTGDNIPLVVTQNGVPSNTVNISIASGGSSEPNLSGSWHGTWSSLLVAQGGSLTWAATQSGSSVSGPISVGNSVCFANGTLSGSFIGSNLVLTGVFPGSTTSLSFSGSFTSTSMGGSYATAGGLCGSDAGTWSMTKN